MYNIGMGIDTDLSYLDNKMSTKLEWKLALELQWLVNQKKINLPLF